MSARKIVKSSPLSLSSYLTFRFSLSIIVFPPVMPMEFAMKLDSSIEPRVLPSKTVTLSVEP